MGGTNKGKHKDIVHSNPRHPRHAEWQASRQQGQGTHFQAPAMAAPMMMAPAANGLTMTAPGMQANWQGQQPYVVNQPQQFMAQPGNAMNFQQPSVHPNQHQGMMGMQYAGFNQKNNFNTGNTGSVF